MSQLPPETLDSSRAGSVFGEEDLREIGDFRWALELEEDFAFHLIVVETRRDLEAALDELGVPMVVVRPEGIGLLDVLDDQDGSTEDLAARRFLERFAQKLEEASREGRPLLIDLSGHSARHEMFWRTVFRRLNERRNGIANRLKAPFLIALPPALEGVLGRNAPDLWSKRDSGMRLTGRRGDLADSRPLAIESILDGERSVEASRKAVEAVREEYRGIPHLFLSDLARSLTRYAEALAFDGRVDEGLGAAGEAIDLYRSSEAASAGSNRAELARALRVLALLSQQQRRPEVALNSMHESIELYRDLAARHPDLYRDDLARSLEAFGLLLDDLGRAEEAQSVHEEARHLLVTDSEITDR